jgi:hypothetical protein
LRGEGEGEEKGRKEFQGKRLFGSQNMEIFEKVDV